MAKISIPTIEYRQLKREAEMFRKFVARFFEFAIQDSVDAVIRDFKQTNRYSKEFLRDLDAGLRASSYSKRYAHPAASKRSRAISR